MFLVLLSSHLWSQELETTPVVSFAEQDWSARSLTALKLFESNEVGLNATLFATLSEQEIKRRFSNWKQVIDWSVGKASEGSAEAYLKDLIKILNYACSTNAQSNKIDSGMLSLVLQYQTASHRAEAHWLFDMAQADRRPLWFVRRLFDKASNLRAEQRFLEGLPSFKTLYNEKGQLIDEQVYEAGVFLERKVFTYRNQKLSSIKILNIEGTHVALQTISYGVDGKLRSSTVKHADGSSELIQYRFGSSGLDQVFSLSELDGIRWFYDLSNRLSSQENWDGDRLTEKLTITYQSPDSVNMASRQTEFPLSLSRKLELFDEKGRLSQEERSIEGVLSERVSYVYDENDNLLIKTRLFEGVIEEWSREYLDKVVNIERYAKNGVPVKVSRYQADNRIEEIYLNGLLRLMVYFEKDIKVKVEEVRDGKVFATSQINKP